ncbi:hypothetical protein [Cucumibacter marinus]|uniref:hypothetical protein n=1 Tax=Cucumibacter marinus TaxID=1121252 RepID=UPI0004250984|nr:hypothetical protein [Cucumibacter marinus]
MPDTGQTGHNPENTTPRQHRTLDVRQARIALRTPWQRWVFIGGIALCLVLGLVIVIALT